MSDWGTPGIEGADPPASSCTGWNILVECLVWGDGNSKRRTGADSQRRMSITDPMSNLFFTPNSPKRPSCRVCMLMHAAAATRCPMQGSAPVLADVLYWQRRDIVP